MSKRKEPEAVVSLGPGGFEVGFGKVMVSESEGMPAVIIKIMVRGQLRFIWCVAEASLDLLERAFTEFRQRCETGEWEQDDQSG